MARWLNGTTTRHVRTLFDVGAIGALTDAQLLERFTTRNGETAELAFAALVERHGPMVLRVCRAALRDEHEAQDAFQATFLVLVRKARSLWVRDSLGPWLHTVASRVASRARSAEARRRRHERKVAETKTAARSGRETGRDDLGPVLHQELDRLPERYRTAVVLCCLEGLAIEQAARQLGWPVGTVQSRLARGREQLRSRLIRRGLAPSAAAFGTLLAAQEAAAALPAALMDFTVQAALRSVSAGAYPAAVAALTEEVLRAMFLTKLKWAAMTLLGAGVVASGIGVYGFQAPGDTPDRPREERPAEPARPPVATTPPILSRPAGPSQPPRGFDGELVKRARIAQRQMDQGQHDLAIQTVGLIEAIAREWRIQLAQTLRDRPGSRPQGQPSDGQGREIPGTAGPKYSGKPPGQPSVGQDLEDVPANTPLPRAARRRPANPGQGDSPAPGAPSSLPGLPLVETPPGQRRLDVAPDGSQALPGMGLGPVLPSRDSQEARLREVERKLDLILKVLEGSKTRPELNPRSR